MLVVGAQYLEEQHLNKVPGSFIRYDFVL